MTEFVPCRAEAARDELGACVRERGHDGPCCHWVGTNLSGGRKSTIDLYEPRDGGYEHIAHGDLSGRFDEDCAIGLCALIDLKAGRL